MWGNGRQIIPRLSEYYQYLKLRRYAMLVSAPAGDPVAAVTFNQDTLRRHNYGKKRVGRPRMNWLEETQSRFWEVW